MDVEQAKQLIESNGLKPSKTIQEVADLKNAIQLLAGAFLKPPVITPQSEQKPE